MYSVAFGPAESIYLIVINIIIEILFLADLVLNFFTEYIDEYTDTEIRDIKQIAINYI